jgi:hypothetical protein
MDRAIGGAEGVATAGLAHGLLSGLGSVVSNYASKAKGALSDAEQAAQDAVIRAKKGIIDRIIGQSVETDSRGVNSLSPAKVQGHIGNLLDDIKSGAETRFTPDEVKDLKTIASGTATAPSTRERSANSTRARRKGSCWARSPTRFCR